MKYIGIFCLVACMALSTGCTIITKHTCHNLDLYDMGLNDALAGQEKADMYPQIERCRKVDIHLKAANYAAGYVSGLNQYCQPNHAYRLGTSGVEFHSICPRNKMDQANSAWRRGLRHYCVRSQGFELGRNGEAFRDFCPADLASTFRSAYDKGHRIYQREQVIKNRLFVVEQTISDTKAKINANNDRIAQLEAGFSGKGSKKAGRAAQDEIRDIRHDNRNLSRRLDLLTLEKLSLDEQITHLK